MFDQLLQFCGCLKGTYQSQPGMVYFVNELRKLSDYPETQRVIVLEKSR